MAKYTITFEERISVPFYKTFAPGQRFSVRFTSVDENGVERWGEVFDYGSFLDPEHSLYRRGTNGYGQSVPEHHLSGLRAAILAAYGEKREAFKAMHKEELRKRREALAIREGKMEGAPEAPHLKPMAVLALKDNLTSTLQSLQADLEKLLCNMCADKVRDSIQADIRAIFN